MAVTPERLPALVGELRPSGVTMLAEKVEDADDFVRTHGLGFSMFQGFFFARPELVAGRRLDEGRARLAELLSQLHRPNNGIDEVAEAVERHPDFAVKLLRLLNSSAFGLARTVESIREAVVMLGVRRVTELATVLALASAQQKPRELLTTGLVRAKMCSNVAESTGRPDPASYFTVGVLSVLDALMDVPMRHLVSPLPLADDVKDALVAREGDKGGVLTAAVAYEQAAWDQLDEAGLAPATLTESYLSALSWSERVLTAV
jgi:EAL and modified HD-GYP domain-containing signal transduction protein